MSDVIIPYRFLLRGGLKAALIATNEIVKDREAEIETDTGMFKLGDGVTHYVDLPYIGIGHFNPAGISDGDQLYWDATAEEWIVGPAGGLPITAAGDLVYGFADSNGAVHAERLPIGTPGQALIVSPGLLPAWGAGYITDAPSDGTPYARQDAGWVPATAGGSFAGGLSVSGGSIELTAALLAGFSVSAICHANINAFTRWRLLVYPAGSLTLDIRVAAPQTPMPLGPGDSIIAAAPPFVTADTDNTSTSLTGWGTSISQGDSVTVSVTACSGVKWFSLEVEGTRIP